MLRQNRPRLFGILSLPVVVALIFGAELISGAEPGLVTEISGGAGRNPIAERTVEAEPTLVAEVRSAASVPVSEVASLDAAIAAFAEYERGLSHPTALRSAMEAYYNYRATRSDLVRKPYFFFVDLGLDNRVPRGFVFDMEKLTVVDGPFMVAHGRGSSQVRDGVPTTFSDREGSNASSLGLYLAEETYSFSGRSGGVTYSSVGLRLRGESGDFNGAARRRGIVSHGAPYVTASGAGRSEGCPAMEPHRAEVLLPLLANGGVVFVYSPNDATWLREDPWL